MELPEKYPYGCSEKEISSALRKYAGEIIASEGNVNKVLQLAPLIVIGHTELQSRQTSRITGISVGLGILSLVIAIVALWVSIANSRTDAYWQTTQSEMLRTIGQDVHSSRDLQAADVELLKSIEHDIQHMANEKRSKEKSARSSGD